MRRATKATQHDLEKQFLVETEQENKKILDAQVQPLLDIKARTTVAEQDRVAAVEVARVAAHDG